jgi:hypothetical protein
MLYDTPQVLSQLSDGLQGEDTKLLSLELAILEGKVRVNPSCTTSQALTLAAHAPRPSTISSRSQLE